MTFLTIHNYSKLTSIERGKGAIAMGLVSHECMWNALKCLGINLPRETKDLHTENCKTLMKEIKDDTNRFFSSLYGLNSVHPLRSHLWP